MRRLLWAFIILSPVIALAQDCPWMHSTAHELAHLANDRLAGALRTLAT